MAASGAQHQVASADTQSTSQGLPVLATTSPDRLGHATVDSKEAEAGSSNDSTSSPGSGEPAGEIFITNDSPKWRSWSVVLGSILLTVPTYGLMSALGLFQLYWQNNQLSAMQPTEISWIISIFGFLTCFLGFPVGLVFDHFGTKVMLPVGCVLYWGSFLALAWCTTYAHFFACFVAAGLSASIPTTVAFCVIDHWFTTHRAMAMGAVTAGAPIGGILFSLVLRKLFDMFVWHKAMYIVSSIIGLFMGLGMLMVRSKPQPRTQLSLSFGHFKSFRFLLFTFAVFCLELVLYTQWGSLPLFAAALQLGDSFYLQVVYNIGAILGRTVPPYFANTSGVFNMLHLMIVFTTVTVFCIWIPVGAQHAAALYVVGFLVGVGTGSFVPLSATCLSRLCDDRGYGKWLGSCYTVVSLGTLIGNPINQALLSSHGVGPRLSVAFQGLLLVAALAASLVVRWRHMGSGRWRWCARV